MKHSKLLKSAVLSTALLWGGATQAQTTGTMSLTVQDRASITVTAGDLSLGSHTGATSSQVQVTCATAGDETTGDNKVTDGSCGEITLSASAGTITYGVGIIPGVFRNSAGDALQGQPVLALYQGSDGTTVVPFNGNEITSGTDVSYVLGATFDIPANTDAGTYTGNYSVNIVIS